MARLPVPHKDTNVWGQLLNQYLRVEHDEDGTLLLRSDGTLDAKENNAYKSTDPALGTSDTYYPSQKAVKNYVDNQLTILEETTIAYATVL
jgi:hypothetical protein